MFLTAPRYPMSAEKQIIPPRPFEIKVISPVIGCFDQRPGRVVAGSSPCALPSHAAGTAGNSFPSKLAPV